MIRYSADAAILGLVRTPDSKTALPATAFPAGKASASMTIASGPGGATLVAAIAVAGGAAETDATVAVCDYR